MLSCTYCFRCAVVGQGRDFFKGTRGEGEGGSFVFCPERGGGGGDTRKGHIYVTCQALPGTD